MTGWSVVGVGPTMANLTAGHQHCFEITLYVTRQKPTSRHCLRRQQYFERRDYSFQFKFKSLSDMHISVDILFLAGENIHFSVESITNPYFG